jgi:hypothetical protein
MAPPEDLIRSPSKPLPLVPKHQENALGMGMETSDHDHCVFSGKFAPHLPPIYLGVYVDDFKYFSTSDKTCWKTGN